MPSRIDPLDLISQWGDAHREAQARVWNKHRDALSWFFSRSRQSIAGMAAGVILLVGGSIGPVMPEIPAQQQGFIELPQHARFLIELKDALPDQVTPLSAVEEKNTLALLSEHFQISLAAQLQDIRLERNYGYIGAEQHLMRYPGDTIDTHFVSTSDAIHFADSGMAPGRGAWGYFAPYAAALTERDIEREKWYVAIQTFRTEGYHQYVQKMSAFFKYRKMLIVNPHNGRGVVAVIGDAGPAIWTGKHLGGSPEVMAYLQRVDGAQKGPVVYYFIDDPTDSIPLGPRETR